MPRCWFAALTTERLRRSAHGSVKELAADINTWVDQWTNDPKPFTWHRTADDILAKLAGYCASVTCNEFRSAST